MQTASIERTETGASARQASPDAMRAAFAAAMSAMYRREVPAYGTLVSIVEEVNGATLESDPGLAERLSATDGLSRLSAERHGAIRLGTAGELATMRRAFAVLGMVPVGYYDLSEAGVPVHSTAFRPVEPDALAASPFRVFTSLLRLELIEDEALRARAAEILAERRIFTDEALALIDRAERQEGLSEAEGEAFVPALLETFRWHAEAGVDAATYAALKATHPLTADVVSFKGPHINHLTPRTLDIDRVEAEMPRRGIEAKAVIEGPPRRSCPILLRQTSFKALTERVAFAGKPGEHTARFGEIEQRGAALTPKGRALYDRLLAEARATVPPLADGSNRAEYYANLERAFEAFPDDWHAMRREGLAYFSYTPTSRDASSHADLDAMIEAGAVRADPIVYEDFLPVSAAGIFQSNLGEAAPESYAEPSRAVFEKALGAKVLDEFEHYAAAERQSMERCLAGLAEGC